MYKNKHKNMDFPSTVLEKSLSLTFGNRWEVSTFFCAEEGVFLIHLIRKVLEDYGSTSKTMAGIVKYFMFGIDQRKKKEVWGKSTVQKCMDRPNLI